MSRIANEDTSTPGPAAARWRLRVTAVLLVLGMAVLMVYAYRSHTGRLVRGMSTVAVANESGAAVEAVCLELTDAAGTAHVREVAVLEHAEAHAMSVHTSDLIVRSVRFRLGTNAHEYLDGGIACPGEVLILAIGPDGTVRTRHER